MIYQDDVPVGADGCLIKCPRCGLRIRHPLFRYRCDCWTDLRNICMPDDPGQPKHINSANARFCETCGAKTAFFHYGFLKPWQEARDRENRKARAALSEPDGLPF